MLENGSKYFQLLIKIGRNINNIRYIGKSNGLSALLGDEEPFLLIRNITITAQTTTNTETPVETPITSQLGGLLMYSRKPGTDFNVPKDIWLLTKTRDI